MGKRFAFYQHPIQFDWNMNTKIRIKKTLEKLIVQISFQFLCDIFCFSFRKAILWRKLFIFLSLLAIIREYIFSFNLYCRHSTKMGIRNAMQFINNVWVMLVALLLPLLLMWLIDFQPAKRVFVERRYFNLSFMFDLSFHIDPCAIARWGCRTISLPFAFYSVNKWMNMRIYNTSAW